MPFVVIRGTYHVTGYSPDGDSIRFEADDPGNWRLLAGPRARLNGRGHAQLRLEAIDTLETHFQGTHQPPALAREAVHHLTTALGITGIEWNPQGTTVVSANDRAPGYIVSRQVEKNGRPVAFAYAGNPPEADGSPLFFKPDRVEQSVNAEMLRSGLSYPTFYKGLFSDLRKALTSIVKEARKGERGVWPLDRTNGGFTVSGIPAISENHVILPKLFRRLVAYLEGGGGISGFESYLSALEEAIFIIPTAHATHFDTIVKVEGQTVRMTELPEDIIFEG